MREKAKNLVAAEKVYWETITSLRRQRHGTANFLELPFDEELPESI